MGISIAARCNRRRRFIAEDIQHKHGLAQFFAAHLRYYLSVRAFFVRM